MYHLARLNSTMRRSPLLSIPGHIRNVMPYLLCMYSCQIQPMRSWVKTHYDHMFVNLQFYLRIELYSQFWMHTKVYTTNQILHQQQYITYTHTFGQIDPPHYINIIKKITSITHVFISSPVSLGSNKPLNCNHNQHMSLKANHVNINM